MPAFPSQRSLDSRFRGNDRLVAEPRHPSLPPIRHSRVSVIPAFHHSRPPVIPALPSFPPTTIPALPSSPPTLIPAHLSFPPTATPHPPVIPAYHHSRPSVIPAYRHSRPPVIPAKAGIHCASIIPPELVPNTGCPEPCESQPPRALFSRAWVKRYVAPSKRHRKLPSRGVAKIAAVSQDEVVASVPAAHKEPPNVTGSRPARPRCGEGGNCWPMTVDC